MLLFVTFCFFIACFGFVILFGAPYVPTLRLQQERALDLLNLKPGQHLLELGCGDGRVLVAAARRGLRATGYELNPLLWIVARLATWRYRRQVRVVLGNFWRCTWPSTDGIYVFLLDAYMPRLHTKINQSYGARPVSVVSYAFEIPGVKPQKKAHGLYLYRLPKATLGLYNKS